MAEYLKMVPLPFWWQKLELKDLSISELFQELLSWNSESKLITPKYITGTYFAAIGATFIFCDLKAGPKNWPLPFVSIISAASMILFISFTLEEEH